MCKVAVGLSIRKVDEALPYGFLEGTSDQTEGGGECLQGTCEVALELCLEEVDERSCARDDGAFCCVL